MLKEKIRYGYNDVVVQPCYLSSVEHRSDVKPFDKNGMLPIFTAPMSTIVGIDNADLFKRNKIYPIIPRNEEFYKRIECLKEFKWIAVSLEEAERIHGDVFLRPTGGKKNKFRILIDVANGHMERLYDVAEKLKKRYGDSIELMVGNISNPLTYVKCCDVGIDYVRCGIGVGLGCITATNVSISDGIISLLDDIYRIKKEREALGLYVTKIIADGGIRGYADIIKAKAAGANYVMIGGLFASCLEAIGSLYHKSIEKGGVVVIEDKLSLEKKPYGWKNTRNSETYDKLYRRFYGMASRNGQVDINGKKLKTSEGTVKEVEVVTTLGTWTENMMDYLRSAMSYCNVHKLEDFNPDNVDLLTLSNQAQLALNK